MILLGSAFIDSHFNYAKLRPGRKLGKLGNLGKVGNFFPRILNPSFRFWL